jgi:pimeloyl-ACP methyl ester carboxylesterase
MTAARELTLNMTKGQLRWRRFWRYAKAASYGVVVGAFKGGCADRLILHPTTNPIPVDGIARQAPTRDGSSIEIWRFKSRGVVEGLGPLAYVLSFVGNASRAERTGPRFAEDWGTRAVEIWAVNYPGYGGSPGPARVSSLAPTALAAYDALQAVAGNRPIFLDARSIGTTAALYLAANRSVTGCVLHNPPPLRELILGRFGWWNLWLAAYPVALSVPKELDSIANAKSVTAPALFLTADADEVVPPAYQRRVIDAYAGPKRIVHLPGAAHNDRATGDAEAQAQAGLDWLWEHAVK